MRAVSVSSGHTSSGDRTDVREVMRTFWDACLLKSRAVERGMFCPQAAWLSMWRPNLNEDGIVCAEDLVPRVFCNAHISTVDREQRRHYSSALGALGPRA